MEQSGDAAKIWVAEFKIHSYEIDADNRATVSALCRFMQESAWQHAENLGVGLPYLMENNLTWVLSRHLIEISYFPVYGCGVFVHTWPSGKDRLSYNRDYKIVDEHDGIIAAATSRWFVIDLVKRRPRNIDSFFKIPIEKLKKVSNRKPVKIEPLRVANSIKSYAVDYCDLDFNSHLNNSRYIEWLLEGIPLDYRRKHELKSLEINYLSEGFLGDKISVHCLQEDDSLFHHSLTANQNNKELCRALSGWKPRPV
jgi:medium-chain acyl-[acyl-carrier-protein] hydrolase